MSDLKHVGVLGMHWGVRKRGPDSADHTTSRELKKKRTSELSNEEIRKVVTRLSLEKQLSSLNPKTTGLGQKLVGQLLSRFGPQILSSFLKKYAKVNVDDIFGKNSPFDTSDFQEGTVVEDVKLLKG